MSRGYHPISYRGRNRHEHRLVPVPRELRLELWRLFTSRLRVAEAVGTALSTADALLDPYGVVRPDVIERASACVAARKETGT